MVSCMAHLNCLPSRAAGVNYWFFLLAHLVVGVGIKQSAKYEMLLRKTDGEMNVQNCGFFAKLRNGDGGDGSYNGLAPSFFEEMTLCHAPAPSYFEEMTRCRHQKLHWRWPGNLNGRSKFRNLGLFTFTRSQLMLQRQLRGWWRLPQIAQTACRRRQKHRREIRKFMPTRSSKTTRKTCFCCYERRHDWWHCALSFPAITRNGFCSYIRKIISRRPWPSPKNRDICIVEFFVDSIYSKTQIS